MDIRGDMRLILVLLLIASFTFAVTSAIESDDTEVVQAMGIIAKIERSEPVNYNNVIIEGDLDISKFDLPKERDITSPIKITNSIIYGSVNLSNTILQELINFRNTEFIKPAVFIGTQFRGDAIFENARFDNNSLFVGSEFNNSALFHYAKFNGSTNFLGAKFKGKQEFHNTLFSENAFFKSAIFGEDTDFRDSIFLGFASFREAQFNNAEFSGTKFKESVDFNLARFDKQADFTGTKFDKELYINDVKFEKLLVSWESIKAGLACNGPTFLSLIKNFREMQQFEDADNCYYQYRDEKRQTGPFDFTKLLDYISWLSCGYGVRLHHPILSAIFIAMLFGIYYESYDFVDVAANRFRRQETNDLYKYDFINNFKISLLFSLMMLLSLPPDWSRFGRDKYRKLVMRHWFTGILERLIGWGLMLLLIGVLTRLMVRY
jgi:uncharacterized protein YjbI with pentapeptide repeats